MIWEDKNPALIFFIDKFAKNIGLNVTNTTPSLVPLEVKEVEECKDMMGLTLKNVSVRIRDGKKDIYKGFNGKIEKQKAKNVRINTGRREYFL